MRDDDSRPTVVIARDILELGAGGRIPTTVHYQNTLGIGSGTVQKALRELKEAGAVSLVARGHQGTFIEELDLAALWSAARLSPLHILLTPSSPPEVTALASAIAKRLSALGIATTAGFAAGARARAEALLRGDADATLMSAGAADAITSTLGARNFHRVDFPGASYYAPGSLTMVTRSDGPQPPRRVAIDEGSEDHSRLTRAAFAAQDVQYVPYPFTTVPRSVLLGDVDAGIWHQVDTLIPLDAVGLDVTELAIPSDPDLVKRISGAVLLTRPSGPIAALFSEFDAVNVGQQRQPGAGSAQGTMGMPLRLS